MKPQPEIEKPAAVVCERCQTALIEHNICEMCGEPSCSLIAVEDRDDSVGYLATVFMCPECEQHIFPEEGDQ